MVKKTIVEETGVIESTSPNTVLSDDDQTKLKQMFKDEFVKECTISECENCNYGDITLELKKCPDQRCGGTMKHYNMLHNRISGDWRKEPAN